MATRCEAMGSVDEPQQMQRLARGLSLCKDERMVTKVANAGKGKKAPSRQPSGSALAARSGEYVTLQLYNTVVEKARSKGVKVAKTVQKVANPYVLPPGEAVKAAKKAGIITRRGNLSPKFK